MFHSLLLINEKWKKVNNKNTKMKTNYVKFDKQTGESTGRILYNIHYYNFIEC